MGTQLTLPQNRAKPQIFRPCLLRPNGWMDQDATYKGVRPQPNRHCVRWGPSSPLPKKGEQPPIFGPCLLWPDGCMDQDATWHEDRSWPRPHCARWGPGSPSPKRWHLVRRYTSAQRRCATWGPSPPKRCTAPSFRPMTIVAKRLDG